MGSIRDTGRLVRREDVEADQRSLSETQELEDGVSESKLRPAALIVELLLTRCSRDCVCNDVLVHD